MSHPTTPRGSVKDNKPRGFFGGRATWGARITPSGYQKFFEQLGSCHRRRKSLRQAVTGRKTPFGRTPKVKGRTAAPAGYVLAVAGLLASCPVAVVVDGLAGRYEHAAFSVVNGAFFGYALVALVGLRAAAAAADARAGLASRLGEAKAVVRRLTRPALARPARRSEAATWNRAAEGREAA